MPHHHAGFFRCFFRCCPPAPPLDGVLMLMVAMMVTSRVQGLDGLTESQQEEVHSVCSIIPDVDVKVDIFVEDEGEIAENDLVTIKVSRRMQNNENYPSVHV